MVTFNDFNDFIGIYLTGNFTGESLVASWNVWVLGMLEFGSSALGISADDMVTLVTAMFNDPDPDWAILCTDCDWTSTLDFKVSDYGGVFVVDDFANPAGKWTIGIGFEPTDVTIGGDSRRELAVDIPFDSSSVNSLQQNGEFTRGTVADFYVSNVTQFRNLGLPVASTVQTVNMSAYVTSVPTPFSLTTDGFNETSDGARLTLISSYLNYTGAGVIESAVIQGTGTKPPQLP